MPIHSFNSKSSSLPNATINAEVIVCAVLLVVFVCGCGSYSYAPPIRTHHYGPPGRVPSGSLDISGSTSIPWATGGPSLSYAVNDFFQLELTGEFSNVNGEWGMGSAGVRFTPLNHSFGLVRLALDLELGFGVGVGGEYVECRDVDGDGFQECGSGDGQTSWQRLAGGGYAGGAIGIHVSFFSTYIRGRIQMSKGENIPLTYWGTIVWGIGFDIHDWVDIYVAGGMIGLDGDELGLYLGYGEAGVAVTIPVARRDRPSEREEEVTL